MNSYKLQLHYWIFFTIAVISLSLPAFSQDEDSLVVVLDTQSQLFPLAIPEIYLEDPSYSSQYLEELRVVSSFDFNVNGVTEVIQNDFKGVQQAKKEGFDAPIDHQAWKKMGVYYVVKIKVNKDKLSSRVFSINNGTVKYISDIPLTGELNADRRKIHQLSDSIYKSLFNKEGIANTRILFTVSDENDIINNNWQANVWESDYDGKNAHQITHDNNYSVTPSYLPPKLGFSSGSFFYVSYRTGLPKIYVASLRDGVGRRFTQLSGNQLHPTVSLQRDKVAFISDTTGNPDLFLQDFSPEIGAIGKPKQLFSSSGAQGSPSFSPDGRYVAFVSNMDGVPRIYVVKVPTSNTKVKNIKVTLISKENRENTSPTWSPNGRYLAYSSKSNGVRQIWVYDFQTKSERALTKGDMNKENPSWAPDSLHLVYNATSLDSAKTNNLYLINLNQDISVKISSQSGDKRFPVWEPRGR
jgi:TolB protein